MIRNEEIDSNNISAGLIPSEILKHIFGYVMVHLVDGEMIRKVCALRAFGSDYVDAISYIVKLLNINSLLKDYQGKDPKGFIQHLSENINKIVNIFPKLERLFLDGLQYLKNDQLKFLLKSLNLKEISLIGCNSITEFNCNDITQFETVHVNGDLRYDLFNRIGSSVYNGKPKTSVKIPEGFYCIVKTFSEMCEFELNAFDTIYNVKTMFEAYTGIYADRQRLIFTGKELIDDRNLSDYGCGKYSTFYVVLRHSPASPKVVYNRPNYDLIKFTPQNELKFTSLYEKKEFKILELDFFNEETCKTILQDILYEKQDGQNNYNITNNLALAFGKYLNYTVIPQLNNLRIFDRKIEKLEDLFVVRYSSEEKQDQDDFDEIHIDSSYVNLNICVFTSSDFEGNEIEFVINNEQEVSEKVAECSELFDGTHLSFKRVLPSKGKALVYLGNHPRKTLNISSGNRFNLVCRLK